MDIDTTNISELPISKNMNQGIDHEEALNQAELHADNIMMDEHSVIHKKNDKTVRFSEDVDYDDTPMVTPNDINREKIKSQNYDLRLETKIIFLASLTFFVMMDNKVKKYFLNILVQIFGTFLKTEHGGMTQLGMFVYTLLYGLILYVSVSTIDLGAMKFALDL